MKPGAGGLRRLLQHAGVFAAALALSAVAYGPALRAAFVSDDVNAIVENEWVAGPVDPVGIFSNFSWWGSGRSDAPGYRPLATLSFALNRAAGGGSPFGFHLTNLVVHAFVASLLFGLGLALGLSTTAAVAGALASSLLPIHSEAVIWPVGRAELGAAAAFAGSALLVLQYRRSGHAGLLVAAGAALFLGMLCKENTMTVLAAPAVYALVLGGGRATHRRDAIATGALLVSFVLYIGLRLSADGPALPEPEDSLLDNPLSVLALPTRLLGALSVLGRYLWLTLWPHPLSIDYSYDALTIGNGFLADRYTLVALVVVAAGAWVAWTERRGMPAIAVSLLLAVAAYSIVSNTIYPIGTVMGERLFYLPSALLCIAAAGAAEHWTRTRSAEPLALAGRRNGPAPRTRVWSGGRIRVPSAFTLAALVALAAGWIFVDMRRAEQWRSPVSVFEAAVAAVPRSSRAHMELGSAYGHVGRIEEAQRHFEQALAINPTYTVAAYNYGNALVRSQRFGEAEAAYRKALTLNPRMARAWHNIALVYRVLQRQEDAADAFGHAAELAPNTAEIRMQQGEALLAAGRDQEAIAAYDAAITLGADTAVVRFNRGVARHRRGGCNDALEDYRRAASMPGAPVQAVQAAMGCLRQQGLDAEAESLLQHSKVANQDTHR